MRYSDWHDQNEVSLLVLVLWAQLQLVFYLRFASSSMLHSNKTMTRSSNTEYDYTSLTESLGVWSLMSETEACNDKH